ncbi:MAG: hypothetical protein QXN59_03050, partial [Candidatus Micrarchaeaceae archaeon]
EYAQSGSYSTKEHQTPKRIGTVERFFKKINVAAISLDLPLSVGDTIEIRGKNTQRLKVESMQIEHKNVEAAFAGDSVGIKVPEEASEGDGVYLMP